MGIVHRPGECSKLTPRRTKKIGLASTCEPIGYPSGQLKGYKIWMANSGIKCHDQEHWRLLLRCHRWNWPRRMKEWQYMTNPFSEQGKQFRLLFLSTGNVSCLRGLPLNVFRKKGIAKCRIIPWVSVLWAYELSGRCLDLQRDSENLKSAFSWLHCPTNTSTEKENSSETNQLAFVSSTLPCQMEINESFERISGKLKISKYLATFKMDRELTHAKCIMRNRLEILLNLETSLWIKNLIYKKSKPISRINYGHSGKI